MFPNEILAGTHVLWDVFMGVQWMVWGRADLQPATRLLKC